MRTLQLLVCVVFVGVGTMASAETYRHVWTTTADFDGGTHVNTNAQDVADQLQLNLGQIETPYLWVSNSSSNTVARISTATGQVLSVTDIPGLGPSRTAVDLDFDCWVALRSDTNGRAYKLDADTGNILAQTAVAGRNTRGVAITAAGHVWISSSVNGGNGYGWLKVEPDRGTTLASFQNDLGSYGIAIDPFGRIWSATSWLGGSSLQWIDADRGGVVQRWLLDQYCGASCYFYGLTVDVNGDTWGTFWKDGWEDSAQVYWMDGDYRCPNDQTTCTVSDGNGIRRRIDVRGVLNAAGATRRVGGRGVAVDANNFVWAVFNDEGSGTRQSYAVKIDGETGEPILATPTGRNSVGITPDADGFIWVVNQSGAGPNPQNLSCPPGRSGNGTVTRLRSSDGSVVATYPTCGGGPYTYSDMAGYNLRSVTLRSGTWRGTHDSGLTARPWGRVRWTSREFDETTLRVRARVADTRGELAARPWVEVGNGDPLPFLGRYLEAEVFFFTRNDFLGPVMEDLTVEGVCEADPEVCDGFDNDCNGVVDDGNPGGGARCDTGLRGVCAIGEQTCDRGRFICRTLGTPQDEVCNEIDDNCDGRIDEGVTNLCGTCGPLPIEICDGQDNDCDGLTDEGVENACGGCGPAPTEVCDGQDNDCDGLVDEGLVNACGTCGPTPDEVCNGADDDCNGLVDDGVANACGGCGPAPTEVCDGADNDCDGLVDEGLINACGTCGQAPVEICDGLDNNCNGRVDEGVLNDCGFCGPVPDEVCDGADNDCDGEVDEGLANRCGGCGDEPVEVCNGVDDNCDGQVDEGVANACGSCGIVPEEVCDGTDNDCDGQVDERVLNACGQCGELGPDVCDGVDADCDGEVDENPECVEGRTCVQGECAEPCAAGECPRGFVCRDNFCLIDRCLGLRCGDGQVCRNGDCLDPNDIACEQVECTDDLVCVGGDCVDDPCEGTSCQAGQACWLGDCLPEGEVACRQVTCGPGEVCEDGACVEDPCLQVRCDVGFVCQDGACEDACDHLTCNTGFACQRGICVEDACFNVVCTDAQTCVAGNCVWDACVDVACPEGQQCGRGGCEASGTCGDSVCVETEVCHNGTCVDRDSTGDGADGDDDGSAGAAASASGCGCHAVDAGSRWRWLLRR